MYHGTLEILRSNTAVYSLPINAHFVEELRRPLQETIKQAQINRLHRHSICVASSVWRGKLDSSSQYSVEQRNTYDCPGTTFSETFWFSYCLSFQSLYFLSSLCWNMFSKVNSPQIPLKLRWYDAVCEIIVSDSEFIAMLARKSSNFLAKGLSLKYLFPASYLSKEIRVTVSRVRWTKKLVNKIWKRIDTVGLHALLLFSCFSPCLPYHTINSLSENSFCCRNLGLVVTITLPSISVHTGGLRRPVDPQKGHNRMTL